MPYTHPLPLWGFAFAIGLGPTFAQNTGNAAQIASSIYSQSSASATASSTAPPSATSSGAGQPPGSTQSTGLVNYYFVFIALVLCAAGLTTFVLWRRKRRAALLVQSGRQNALASDVTAWDPERGRRRHGQGRFRSAEVGPEEGLNEHGEAPPPYIPKTREEQESEQAGDSGPAIPLQTLSRDDVGLKPPDYSETHPVAPLEDLVRTPSASGANSSSTHDVQSSV